MVKHKLEIGSSSKAKKMKSKTKYTNVEIQSALLDQIHFLVCMYITMWASKKEEHAWMIEAKLDDYCWFNWNTSNLPIVKEIIYSFQVSNGRNILHGKQISLDSFTIDEIFKLPMKGIMVPTQKVYDEEWSKYFEGGKDKHYMQDSRYILVKVYAFGMQI